MKLAYNAQCVVKYPVYNVYYTLYSVQYFVCCDMCHVFHVQLRIFRVGCVISIGSTFLFLPRKAATQFSSEKTLMSARNSDQEKSSRMEYFFVPIEQRGKWDCQLVNIGGRSQHNKNKLLLIIIFP